MNGYRPAGRFWGNEPTLLKRNRPAPKTKKGITLFDIVRCDAARCCLGGPCARATDSRLLSPGLPGATDILRVAFLYSGDGLGDAVGRGELNHVADAGQHDELGARHRGGQGLGMNVGRNDLVEVAGDDHGRDGDGSVSLRLRRHETLE